ncbi:MAG: AAA family ATPase [Oscillospiraceae bacterium]|nr:AAA family ATPase [Oscillospiraceae bacterium]
MRLKRLTASFGRLDKQTLELCPGLNVLEAPNEGGKSTWAAFLKVMLYGLDTKSRDKKGFLADKNRYRPWSGAPMEGVLECEIQGRELVLRRWTKGSVPMGAFSAVWTDTGEPVSGMTGDNAGSLLIGVGRDTFERSAFLRQAGLAVDQSPELEKRIAALVSSGEEGVSFSATEDRLKGWLRRRQYRNSGQIPKLEAERDSLDGILSQMEEVNRRILASQAELEELAERKKQLEGDLFVHKRLKQRKLNQEFGQAQLALEQAQEEEVRLKSELSKFGPIPPKDRLRQAQEDLAYIRTAEDNCKQAQKQLAQEEERVKALAGEIDRTGFGDLPPEEAQAQAGRDAERCRKAQQRPVLPLVLTALAPLTALILAVLTQSLAKGPLQAVLPILGCALVLAGAIVLSLRWKKEKDACGVLMSQYGAEDPEGVLRRAAQYQEQCGRLRQGEADRDRVAQASEEWRLRLEQGRADLFGFVYTFAPEVNTLIGVSAAISRALNLEDKLNGAALKRQTAQEKANFLASQGGRSFDTLEMLYEPEEPEPVTAARLDAAAGELSRVQKELAQAQGEQKVLGDPAELLARREAIEEQLAALRLDCQALEAALDGLNAANSQLQARFSPALNARASQYLDRLTGGKYGKVTLDRDFDAAAEEAGELAPRPVLALSQGTADQLYLAVRLAICSLVLPEDDLCPLVLDDALTNFDDGRLTLALDLLQELAAERQILLFTCHRREGLLLEGREGVGIQSLSTK